MIIANNADYCVIAVFQECLYEENSLLVVSFCVVSGEGERIRYYIRLVI